MTRKKTSRLSNNDKAAGAFVCHAYHSGHNGINASNANVLPVEAAGLAS
jgi:hypothetical protein